MSKLQIEINKKISGDFPFSIKTFPEDGHTFEDLYNMSIKELELKNSETDNELRD